MVNRLMLKTNNFHRLLFKSSLSEKVSYIEALLALPEVCVSAIVVPIIDPAALMALTVMV